MKKHGRVIEESHPLIPVDNKLPEKYSKQQLSDGEENVCISHRIEKEPLHIRKRTNNLSNEDKSVVPVYSKYFGRTSNGFKSSPKHNKNKQTSDLRLCAQLVSPLIKDDKGKRLRISISCDVLESSKSSSSIINSTMETTKKRRVDIQKEDRKEQLIETPIVSNSTQKDFHRSALWIKRRRKLDSKVTDKNKFSNLENDTKINNHVFTIEEGSTIDYVTSVHNNQQHKKETSKRKQKSKKNNKVDLVDYFTEDQVKKWSKARIQAWRGRESHPDQFYYRFADPTVGQQNGAFTPTVHKQWIDRYNEFKEKNWAVGTCWGLFSKSVPHKCGYQCANYYRKLIEKGTISDDSYHIIDGKLRKKRDHVGIKQNSCELQDKLSDLWETKDLQNIEKEVDEWILKYHSHSVSTYNKKVTRKKSTLKKEIAKLQSSPRKGVMPQLPDSNLFWEQNASLLASYRRSKKVKKKKKSKTRQLDLSLFIPGIKPPPPKWPPPEKVVIPKPLPLSWAKRVRPYEELNNSNSNNEKSIIGSVYIEATLNTLDVNVLGDFDGIVMDPPWKGYYFDDPQEKGSSTNQSEEGYEGTITPEQLSNLPITDQLIKKGMLFIWIEKEYISQMVKVAASWGFTYVENFVWVIQSINNTIITKHARFIRRSKLSLLMFRKEGDIELRHQRTADVVFDFENTDLRKKPLAMYKMIETLLPEAQYNPTNKRGRLLHLWSRRNEHRHGWTCVHMGNVNTNEE